MVAGKGMVEVHIKTSVVELSYPSVVRFTGHVQLKGVRPRTVEVYAMMMRLLARWAGQDPCRNSSCTWSGTGSLGRKASGRRAPA